jgi:hypothetical protein
MKLRSKLRISVLIALGALFLCASSASATGHEGHHQHGKQVSPFAQKRGISLHCALKGHTVNDLCPHLLKAAKDKTIPCVIGSSCGSHPFQKKSTSSGSSLLFINDSFFQMSHYKSSQTLYLGQSIPSLHNNDSVDPPPKLS